MTNNIDQFIPLRKMALIGLLIGFLLNLTGWIGNNIILGSMWDELGNDLAPVAWRESVWSEVFSLAPDFLYGIAIAWMIVKTRLAFESTLSTSISVGVFVSLVGGITTYFAIANSGFVPWSLAIASFILVLACKIPLAVLAGILLYREPLRKDT
jgi:hypothetical protein